MLDSMPRSARWVLGLAVVVLGLAGPTYAADLPPQTGGAASGIYNWYTVAAGQSVEWVFDYKGSNNPTLIAFGVDPANSIAVKVYDDGQWRALGAGDRSVQPVGRGTAGTAGAWSSNKDLIDNGSLFWEAGARPAVVFHIQVINSTQAPARYWIAQAGPGAGGLTPAFLVAAATPPAQSAAAPAAPAQPATAGQTASAGTGAPPPPTLPVSGGDTLLPLVCAGLALAGAGWRARCRLFEREGSY